jgi:hypothetical protein
MPAPIACDPDNPREEDIIYATHQRIKIWSWIEDSFVKGDMKSNTFTLNAVKNQFPMQSNELLTITMRYMCENDGKIFISSGPRSRTIEYTLKVDTINELLLKEKELEEAENAAKAQVKLEKQLKAQTKREKEEMVSSSSSASSSSGEKRSLDTLNDKENNARKNSTHSSSSGKSHKKSKTLRTAVSEDTKAVVVTTSPSRVIGELLFDNPASLEEKVPLSTDKMSSITDFIVLSGADGDGVLLQNVYEALEFGGISLDDLYMALDHLCNRNRIMVDWNEEDKRQSVIYQL